MSSRLKLDSRASTESLLPIVGIRNVVLDTDKLIVNFAIKVLSPTSAVALLEASRMMNTMEIKTVLSFDPNLTRSLANKKISLSQNFNQRDDAIERIIRADNYKIQGNGPLFRIRTSDAEVYYEVPFSLIFDNMEEDIEHLSCFVFPYIVSNSSTVQAGKINSVLAIEQFKPVMESYICYTPEEKIWIGDVHKMPNNRLMSGRSHTSQDVVLRHEKVSNSKFHNYRVLHEISGILEEAISETETLRELTEFSNIYLSPDQDGNIRFLFGVDCRGVFQNNVKNKHLVDMANKRIEEIRIYRYRSDTVDDERVLIVYGEDSPEGLLSPADRSENGVLLASMRETNFQNSSMDYRYFTVTDFEDKNFGVWNYAVEIDFEDNTEKELNNIVNRLRKSSNDLETYIEAASLSNNISSGRFNQSYAESNIESKTNLLRRCIRSYVKGLSLFFVSYEYDELARNLTNITFPKSGNLEGLMFFQELMHDLIYKLEDLARKDNFLSKNKTIFESSVSHLKDRKNTFTVSRDYSNIEESYVVKDFKDIQLDLLYSKNEQPENLIGLPIISKQRWTLRMGDLSPSFVRIREKEINLQDESDRLIFHNFLFSKEDRDDISNSVLEDPLSQVLRLLGEKSSVLLADTEVLEIKSQKMILLEQKNENQVKKYVDESLFDKSENEKKRAIDKLNVTTEYLEKEKINSSAILSEALDNGSRSIGEVSYTVEILTGTGTSIVDENWLPLTGDMLDSMTGAALIRLRANVVDFSFVNEYFILGLPEITRMMNSEISFRQPKDTVAYSEFLNFSVPLLRPETRRKRKYKKLSSEPEITQTAETTPAPPMVSPAPSMATPAAPMATPAAPMATPSPQGGSGY